MDQGLGNGWRAAELGSVRFRALMAWEDGMNLKLVSLWV